MTELLAKDGLLTRLRCSATFRQTACPLCDDLCDLVLLARVHVIGAIDERRRYTNSAFPAPDRGDDGIEIGPATRLVTRAEESEQGDAHARDWSIGGLHAEEIARSGVGEERVDVQEGRGAAVGRKIALGRANARVPL